MNKKKVNSDKLVEILGLYRAQIPVPVIAKLLEISPATIEKYIPKADKELAKDFKNTPKSIRLHLLKMYAWLITDPMDSATELKTLNPEKLASLLFTHLNLKEWIRVIEGWIVCLNAIARHQFAPTIPDGYKAFIRELHPEYPIKESARTLFKAHIQEMHIGKESLFPSEEYMFTPAVALESLLESMRTKTTGGKVFDGAFVEIIEKAISSFSPREQEVVKAWFGLTPDITVGMIVQGYELTQERVRQIKNRIMSRLTSARYGIFTRKTSFSDLAITNQKLRDLEELYKVAQGETLKAQNNYTSTVSGIRNAAKVIIGHLPTGPHSTLLHTAILTFTNLYSTDLDYSLITALDEPLEDIDLSVRAFNCLKAAKINSLKELVQYTEEDLMLFRNFGQKSIAEIQQALMERGLSFGMKI